MTSPRTIAVVTGTRAEFGLLRPVMRAIADHPGCELRVIVTGTHRLPPDHTEREVEAAFPVAARVPMQSPGETGFTADAAALGRGVGGFASVFASIEPDVVVVLGDRIEAFAATSAASIGGIRVAHLHGGDRAEGVADEAMRHAITKLAHVHLPATEASAARIRGLGEDEARIHVVGSPAIDGLAEMPAATDDLYDACGQPEIIVLHHPVGDDEAVEHARSARLIAACATRGRTLVLHPNHDPGREGIVRAIRGAEGVHGRTHLRRPEFIGLLRRARMLVGNSSAGRIEAASIPIRVVDIGPRQAGRECPAHVIALPDAADDAALDGALDRGLNAPIIGAVDHPYGDGTCGIRVASVLAAFDSAVHGLRKRNTF